MKKFCYLLSLLMLSLAGALTAWADDDGRFYTASTFVDPANGVKEGVDYVFKGVGFGNSSDTYLNVLAPGNNGSTEITSDCIYQFVTAGDVDGMPTYYIKQKSSGLYLRLPGGNPKGTDRTYDYATGSLAKPSGWGENMLALTEDLDDACRFWALKADSAAPAYSAYPDERWHGSMALPEREPMFIFPLVQAFHAADGNSYIRWLQSYASHHCIASYYDVNCWFLYTDVTEVTGLSRLQKVLMSLLPEGVENAFTAGTDPGNTDVEAYAELEKVFNQVTDLLSDENATDAQADELADALVAAYNKCDSSVVMPEAGKYYFLTGNKGRANASGSATAYCNGSGWYWEYQTQPITEQKYVIQLEAGETPGTFLVRSPLYDAYMGAIDGNSKVINAVDKAAAAEYLIARVSGSLFNLSNEGISQGVHAQESGKSCVGWNKTADASQWEFETVPDDLLEGIEAAGEQIRLNRTLNDLYDEAWRVYAESRVYSSDAAPDEDYTSHGLISTVDQIFTSQLDATEGNDLSVLLNGETEGSAEYIHTTWHASDAPNHYHFIGAKLNEAVDAVMVKFSRRMTVSTWKTAQLSYPTELRVYASNDTAKGWTWVGDTKASFVNADSAKTLTAGIDLGGNYQYVRFDVTATGNNGSVAPAGGNAYPFFYISEFGVYKAAYDPDNSPYSAVPEADGKALGDALTAARTEIVSDKATQQTVDQLQTAYDKFLESYADPQLAIDAVAEAQTLLDSARVGEGMAEVTQKAYDDLKSAISEANSQIKKVMTMAELTAVLNRLEQASDSLIASAVMPEPGKYYWMLSQGASAPNAAIRATNNSDGQQLTFGAHLNGNFDETTAQTDYNYVWLFRQDADGKQYLQNVGTGFYLDGNYSANPSTTAAKSEVKIEYSKAGQLKVRVLQNDTVGTGVVYLNNNSSIVTKFYRDDSNDNSDYAFREVDFGDDPFTYVDVQPGWHFMCLPYEITGCSSGLIYTVVGINADNELVLQSASDGVAAGDPFVYYLDASDVVKDDFGVMLSNGIVDKGNTVAGVQGFLSGYELKEPGYGILTGSDTITVNTESVVLDNNSAILTKEVPTTAEEGIAKLLIDGNLSGTATGISGVVIVPKDGKIYDLQGRRVSRPGKGIYIVNGKKMETK